MSLFSPRHITAGFTAVLVGYTSSVVIIIEAAKQAGASSAQISSWLLILGLAMGITSIGFSLYFKKPVLTAWSTPGAALLVSMAAQFPLEQVIAAFAISAILTIVTGFIRPVRELLHRIPAPIATAMLAGILIPFCTRAFLAAESDIIAFCVMFSAFVFSKRILPQYSMLILLICALGATYFRGVLSDVTWNADLATLVWVTPQWSLSATINLALPLYLITMLSQNLPGIAMLQTHGYKINVKKTFITSGLLNTLFAPFGCLSINLAAISAAICMNESVDKDENMRYKASCWAGVFYIFAGIWSNQVVQLFLALPAEITHLIAGLALLSTLTLCLTNAVSKPSERDCAILTLLVTLSGISLFGVSSAILGLIVGIAYYLLFSRTRA